MSNRESPSLSLWSVDTQAGLVKVSFALYSLEIRSKGVGPNFHLFVDFYFETINDLAVYLYVHLCTMYTMYYVNYVICTQFIQLLLFSYSLM